MSLVGNIDDIFKIVTEISKGNSSAYTQLYNLYWEEILKYVLKKIKNLEIAEDIVHDLFLSIWKNRDRLHEVNNIKAYLYSGARYLTIAHFHKSSLINHEIDVNTLEIGINDTSIDNILHYRYLLDLLHDEIENLPEKCKLVFKESRFNHKTIKEIAIQFEISESTVENHINKALKVLKKSSNNFMTFLPFIF